jgi:hypothetical protein
MGEGREWTTVRQRGKRSMSDVEKRGKNRKWPLVGYWDDNGN